MIALQQERDHCLPIPREPLPERLPVPCQPPDCPRRHIGRCVQRKEVRRRHQQRRPGRFGNVREGFDQQGVSSRLRHDDVQCRDRQEYRLWESGQRRRGWRGGYDGEKCPFEATNQLLAGLRRVEGRAGGGS